MGLQGALVSSITGIQANSTAISNSAVNIANASTAGYKASTTIFSTLVTDSGGGGVSARSKILVESQGLIESTGRDTDLSINGNGFFGVQDNGGSTLLTRTGDFDINNSGELVNSSGNKLLGWPLDNDGKLPGETGNANTTAAESIESLEVVDTNSAAGTASATTTVRMGLNLNAGQSVFQGATAVLDFTSTANASMASTDIIVPAAGMQGGDTITFTSNSIATIFTYGGIAKSFDVSRTTTFGATSTANTFSASTTAPILTADDKFTITVGSGTHTFTYKVSSPDTANGEFNSFDSLATAINLKTGLTARTFGTILYVSSDVGNEAVTFSDVASSNLHYELGFSNVAAAASGVNRFNTVAGLDTLIQASTIPDLDSVVKNASNGVSINIFSADPTDLMVVAKNQATVVTNLQSRENGTNGVLDLIVPVTVTSTSPASSMVIGTSTLVLDDDQVAAGNGLTLTYGGIDESGDITVAPATFGSSLPASAFSAGIANGDTLLINDGGGATTFTYLAVGTPDTSAGSGQFNSLTTLAEAINNSTDFVGKIANNRMYVSPVNAALEITYTQGGGNTADFVTDMGLTNVAAAAGRFSTLSGLAILINADADYTATATGTSSGALTITADTGTLEFGDSANDLMAELGLADNSDVGDGFFTELKVEDSGGTQLVAATASSASIAASYDPTNVDKNMSGGKVGVHFPRNITIFDSLGTGHDFRMSFLKTGSNEWSVEFYALTPSEVSGVGTDGLVKNGTIVFNGDGTLRSVSSALSAAIDIDWTTGATKNSITFDLGTAGASSGTTGAVLGLTDGLRQFDSAYNVEFVEQNGVAAGQFSGIEVAEDGTVNAKFSNGEVKAIYRLPILTVANQNALQAKSGNVYLTTQLSGEINLKKAGAGGAGTIVPKSLEGSTADIANELVNTIAIQANYNANAAAVSIVKAMTEELNRRV